MQEFPFISTQEAAEHQNRGAVLIDVRSKKEFAAAHPGGSISVPLERLTEKIRSVASPRQTVLLYCTSGERSQTAARVLSRLGYTHLFVLKED